SQSSSSSGSKSNEFNRLSGLEKLSKILKSPHLKVGRKKKPVATTATTVSFMGPGDVNLLLSEDTVSVASASAVTAVSMALQSSQSNGSKSQLNSATTDNRNNFVDSLYQNPDISALLPPRPKKSESLTPTFDQIPSTYFSPTVLQKQPHDTLIQCDDVKFVKGELSIKRNVWARDPELISFGKV
ncbi:hypothetical protein HK100_003729, partial [Physocladia obscura]